jgi:hypothetical protein
MQNDAAAKALLPWAAAQREAWLDAVANPSTAGQPPTRILPSEDLGQQAWCRRVELLRDAGRQLRSFNRQ